MYALNTEKDSGRILSACVVLPNGKYDNMPIVETLPDGNIADYLYADGEYIYNPLPSPEQTETTPSLESRVETLETSNAELTEAMDMLLSGVTSDE